MEKKSSFSWNFSLLLLQGFLEETEYIWYTPPNQLPTLFYEFFLCHFFTATYLVLVAYLEESFCPGIYTMFIPSLTTSTVSENHTVCKKARGKSVIHSLPHRPPGNHHSSASREPPLLELTWPLSGYSETVLWSQLLFFPMHYLVLESRNHLSCLLAFTVTKTVVPHWGWWALQESRR